MPEVAVQGGTTHSGDVHAGQWSGHLSRSKAAGNSTECLALQKES